MLKCDGFYPKFPDSLRCYLVFKNSFWFKMFFRICDGIIQRKPNACTLNG